MMNAPAAKLDELSALLPGLESPSVIPLDPRGHDRDPRRRRCRRGLEPPPPPQGGRRVGHPRPADREDRRMSPTPVTMSDPTAPAGYTWEATNEQVAARYGVPVERIVRFDLNTSPAPPELVDQDPGRRSVRDRPVGVPAVRLPTADRGGRGALRRRRPTRSSSGPVPTRSSTSWPRRSCRPAGPRSSRPRRTRCTGS